MAVKLDNTLSYIGKSEIPPSFSINDKSNIMDINPDHSTFEYKIVLLGDAAVGKTALLKRYMKDEYSDIKQCSIGAEFESKTIILDQNSAVKLNVWDTCGEEKFRALTKQYYRDANGILLLFDLSSEDTFKGIESWMNQIKEASSIKNGNIILVGSKADLDKRVAKSDVEKLLRKHRGLQYVEISSKTGMNVELIFDKIMRSIMNPVSDEDEDINQIMDKGESSKPSSSNPNYNLNSSNNKNTTKLSQNQETTKSGGCC